MAIAYARSFSYADTSSFAETDARCNAVSKLSPSTLAPVFTVQTPLVPTMCHFIKSIKRFLKGCGGWPTGFRVRRQPSSLYVLLTRTLQSATIPDSAVVVSAFNAAIGGIS